MVLRLFAIAAMAICALACSPTAPSPVPTESAVATPTLDVPFADHDLLALQDRISGDWDWMRAFAIAPVGVWMDVSANHVEIDVSSANSEAASIIVAHYAMPAGMISVLSDGTGAALIPGGTVHGRVVDAIGKPPGDAVANDLNLGWTSDGPGDCGGGDIGYGVTGEGQFELPCQAGGHTIEVQISVPEDGWKAIASGHVIAIEGATVELVIRLDAPWSSAVTP
jgi:hypothetical protein